MTEEPYSWDRCVKNNSTKDPSDTKNYFVGKEVQ